MALNLDESVSAGLLRRHYGLTALAMSRFSSELATVFRVETMDGAFSLKLMDAAEHRLDVVQWQAHLMEVARKSGLPVAETLLCAGEAFARTTVSEREVLIHVTRWLDGRPLLAWSRTPAMLVDAGNVAARLSRALSTTPGPPAEVTHPWRLERSLESIARGISGLAPEEREPVLRAAELFRRIVLPRLDEVPRAVVHHDLHDSNLLYAKTPTGTPVVSGILDFGDALDGIRLAELAVLAGYGSRGVNEPVSAFTYVVEGWSAIMPLTHLELELLLPAATARLAVNISLWRVLGAGRADTYASDRSDLSLRALRSLLCAYDEGITDQLLSTIPTDG